MTNHKYFIKHLGNGFLILFVFILLLNFFNVIPDYWSERTLYIFFAVLICGTVFIFLEIKDLSDFQRKNFYLTRILPYLFLLSLITVIVKRMLGVSILDPVFLELVSISISLGFLTVYSNFHGVWNNLDDERDTEIREEHNRKSKFENTHYKLNNMLLIGPIIRWFYKEGAAYSLSLAAVLVLAFVLRVYQLGKYGLMVDEQFAYSAGQSVIHKFSFLIFTGNYYYRGWLYTLIVAISFLLLGVSEFSLRFPGVLLGTFTIVPLYLLMKKITNKKLALVSGLFLAVFTWHIFYSRFARHYILASFLLILSLYYTYLYMESKYQKYQYHSLITTALMTLTVKELLLIPLLYLLLLVFTRKHNASIREYAVLSLGYIIPIIITLFIPEKVESLATSGNQTVIAVSEPILFKIPQWLNEWISQTQYKYYFIDVLYNFFPSLAIILFIFTLSAFFIYKRKQSYGVLLVPLGVFILMNVVGRHKPWTIRQMSFILPFFIILIILTFSLMSSNKWYVGILLIISFLAIANPIQLSQMYSLDYGTAVTGTMFQLTSAERAIPDYKTPVDYLVENIREKDKVISDPHMTRAYLFEKVNYSVLSDFNEDRDLLLIEQALHDHERVWVVNTVINDERFHFKRRNGKVRQFLDSNQDNIVYIGKDNLSTVYLFNKNDGIS